MLTIEKLSAFGADTEKGIRICSNKEDLYLLLVKSVPGSDHFRKLEEYVRSGDYASGYLEAQTLAGNTSNLCLDPLSKPIVEIADHLRAKDEMDYQPLLKQIENIRVELEDLCREDDSEEKKPERCPICGKYLVLRDGMYGPFWGCGNYPSCTFTKDI